MGCASAKPGGAGPAKPTQGSEGGKAGKPGELRLLEEYSVGQTLGEGAFGVVSNCKHRTTGVEYAVKMVDKVETPVDQIKKEAAMLESLNHQNIVKVHGVYYERCFVCIVMDKYSGGDLVEGLQKHLKERGQINCHHVVHVSRQMGASVQYLHSKLTVHRDSSGDNYLMDRRDMTDPDCKVVLTDFGTACNVTADERLSAAVGTKIFWAPEFFDKNYGMKVDVWAMGVIMYGLVSGRFPFRDEADIRAKELKIPKRVHQLCEDFIKKILEKKEAARLSADQVMAHGWVDPGNGKRSSSSRAAVDAGDDEGPTQDMRVEDANDGIKERRQELINRLNKEHDILGGKKGTSSQGREKQSSHAEGSKFTLKDKANNRMVYEWFDKARQKASNVSDTEGKAPSESLLKESGTDHKMFSQMLEDHNIKTSAFGTGKAKTLPELVAEVDGGAARLMLDATEHKKLVRVCDLVVLILKDASGERILIETEEQFEDGRKRVTNRLPGTKKEPYENTRQVSERILKEFLKLDPKGITLDLNRIERVEEEIESISYPGVTSVYRKELVEGVFSMTDAAALATVGLPSFGSWDATDAKGNTKIFNWMTSKQCEEKQIKLQPKTQEVSTLVRAPIGLNEEALRRHLTNCGVDVSKFGGPDTKTLKEFSAELIKGESTLTEDSSGNVLRVVDIVVLLISRKEGSELLVQTEQISAAGTRTTLNRLPGAKRRPDENQFLSARRIIKRQLEIDENMVFLDRSVQSIEEVKHAPAYPGLKTVYRKRLVSGALQMR
ncbi:unnamed protein product [Prorocentrum cordatum]|uniref:Protein kinase domain-containing protein n=1 Tax=Prorocentrum cordatum TaxID=2364126 RepID=A0ABN9SUJ4_9DINO|nr:unnamed protein product [Polarella glacialis]CAK0836136.1 unnamed protein product [Polarella glacialis]